jgi:hypothetical protein
LCLALALPLALTSCSEKLGTPLLTLEDETLTENMFLLLLSRVKGNLATSGYSVSSDTLWDTVISSDGTLYDEYVIQSTLQEAKEYVAAAVMFDELGLTLSDSTLDEIDTEIQDMIDGRAGGSKSEFNSLLSAYGANVDILRALYIMEAKYSAVITSLYGSDGSKIADNVLQEYLDSNAVCFRQLLIRSFYYVYETDLNGDEIYYLSEENNGKVSNIAYDTEKGSPRLDEFGKTIVDANGDTVYYTSDGRIAYDTESGVRAYVYDSNGNVQTQVYSSEELAAHREAANEVLSQVQTSGVAVFESLLEEYEVAGDEAYITDGSYCFLYTTGDNGYDYLNDIADTLADMEVGEAAILDTEYGCHVILRYAMPSDAASNDDYSDWFSDLVSRVVEQLFSAKCAPYVERITVDSDVFAALPSMKEVAVNYYY